MVCGSVVKNGRHIAVRRNCNSMEMKAAIEKYLGFLAVGGYSQGTVNTYARDLALFGRQLNFPVVEAVTRDHIEGWLAHEYEKGNKTVTLARKLAVIVGFFRFLVDHDKIERNPAERIPRPRYKNKPRQPLTLAEVQRLLECPSLYGGRQALRDKAIMELLYSSGMRLGELCALDVHDVDLERGEARVVGKGGKQRVVFIGEPAGEAIRRYLQVWRSTDKDRTSALFISSKCSRLSPCRIQVVVKKHGKLAGIQKNLTPHVLRHTFATHIMEAGCDLRTLQEMLGHKLLATTQIYTHVTSERQRDMFFKAHPRAGVSRIKQKKAVDTGPVSTHASKHWTLVTTNLEMRVS